MKISKKMARVMTVLTIVLGIILAATNVFATDYYSITQPQDPGSIGSSINNMGGMILSIVQIIGVAVAVIMLIVLAIKYIAASPDDKAEIKKHAFVYVVGAIILFAASALVGWIKSFAGQIS